MFAQHEQIIRDIFTRVATETAGLGQRVAQLEQGHLEAGQTVASVVGNITDRAAADVGLRQELLEFAGKLQESENHVKAVHNEFGGHVEGAFTALDIKLRQLESLVNSASSASSGTAAATFSDAAVNINVAQAYEIKVITAALQELGENRVNVQTQLASLASKPCHCPDVDKLMSDMTASSTASAQAFSRIQAMELVLTRLVNDGAPVKSPPGVPFVLGGYSFPGAAPCTGDRGEPFTTRFMGQKT